MVVYLSEEKLNYWYSQDKWTLKDIVEHPPIVKESLSIVH
jgi:hypothetical protein